MALALVHEMFVYRGGAERLSLLMARCLEAELLLAGFVAPTSFDPAQE
jgi:hypothetical protein